MTSATPVPFPSGCDRETPGTAFRASAALALLWAALAAPDARAQSAADTIRLAEIRVVGARAELARIPGSAFVVDTEALRRWRPFTVNEVLRRVPGLFARDEEGFGLRPNIGVRGLNPTRSTKVLLLEDGLPLTYAPYGDNASYYHPPLERFERVEVLKGSGQILFGPQTIGGVINYVTPAVPREPTLTIGLTPGTRDYLGARVRAGGTRGRLGALVSYDRKQGDGARANIGTRLDDVTIKSTLALSTAHALTARGTAYRERSNATYSGLTEAEWAADPRQNPFRNDSMLMDRWGTSLTHRWNLARGVSLTTSAYVTYMSREWWRQSSNSAERPNDRSDPNCGGMQNLNTTCGNQGRVRSFLVWGIEPRVRAAYTLFGVPAALEGGVRVHDEYQDRRQLNGDAPNARAAGPSTDANSGVVEDNVRENRAYAAFAQQRLFLGRWTLTPGLRLEHIRYERANQLVSPAVTGRTSLTQLVPGVGVTFAASPAVTVFAGAHRGFAPPRTEDIINNATGGVVDLDPELSWNYEAGVRAELGGGRLALEATAFRLDFENQIVPASVAGGTGATLTSAGRTLHQGLELSGRLESAARTAPHGLFLEAALTWVPVARYEGPRFAYVGTGGSDVAGKVYASQNGAGTRTPVSVTGNRLPYAPEFLLTTAIGYRYRTAADARLEAVHVSRQFGDALNTSVLVPDGQQGPIPASTVWNASASWTITPTHTTLFVAVKNLFDRTYIVDRTRGLLPSMPRVVQAGLSQSL
jgi:Fe(3+) dicitrate transport protein